MSGDQLRRQLKWFLLNLDLLLEDYELERQGIQVDLYFDTLDVNHAVLGLYAFHTAGNFNVRMPFQTQEGRPLRDRTLVLCLAYNGRLGKINMLPPHQSEFLEALNRDFGIHENLHDEQLVKQFLLAVSRTESIKQETASLIEISTLEEVSEQEALLKIKENAGDHAASAMNFYKIIELIKGPLWKTRLLQLRKGILELEPKDIDYEQLMRRAIFSDLYKAFTLKRGDRWKSNLADAVALTILADHVKEVNEGKPVPIPRFFVSSKNIGESPLFVQLLRSTGLESLFEYGIPGRQGAGSRSTVIRRADYFVFKSTFQSPPNASDLEEKSEFTPAELYELRKRISRMLETPGSPTPESLDEIVAGKKSLKQLIEDVNTCLFFKNVWLPSSKGDVELVLEDLNRAANELKSEVLEQGVDNEIREFKTFLAEKAIKYEAVKQIWGEIKDAAERLQKQWAKRLPDRADYLRVFGLLRFAFPESGNDRIQDVLDDLLNETEDERSTYINIVKACYSAQTESSQKAANEDDLVAAAAVLWAARTHDELADLLSKIDPLPHYSLELIYTAALFELPREDDKGLVMLERLEERHRQASNAKEKVDLAVGLAYLKFHLWRKLGYGPAWEGADISYKSDDQRRDLIGSAIQLALEAWNSLTLGGWDEKKRIYALNQYLYYLVMEGDVNKIQKIHEAARALLAEGMKPGANELWQYRFDDTLARYYNWLAHLQNTEEAWRKNMLDAELYSEQAKTKAPWDESVVKYSNIIRNQLEVGFKKEF
jgi:hypothetical protein